MSANFVLIHGEELQGKEALVKKNDSREGESKDMEEGIKKYGRKKEKQ